MRVGAMRTGGVDAGNDRGWRARLMLMFMMNEGSRLFYEPPEKSVGPIHSQDQEVTFHFTRESLSSHFDHRFGSYARIGVDKGKGGRGLPHTRKTDYENPEFQISPRYWIARDEVESRLRQKAWGAGWLLAWRDITNAKVERTVVASIIPRYGAGDTCPLFLPQADAPLVACLLGNLNSLAFDYIARQKVAGVHLRFGYMEQFPILATSAYAETALTVNSLFHVCLGSLTRQMMCAHGPRTWVTGVHRFVGTRSIAPNFEPNSTPHTLASMA